MASFSPGLRPVGESRDKGLKAGALGLASSVVMGVASIAPAYSLAATLFFVVAAVGLKSPLVAVLAFGPKTGWAGGWGVVAADVLSASCLLAIR